MLNSIKMFLVLCFLTVSSLNIFANGWSPQSSGTTNNLYSICFLDNLTGYTVGDIGTIRKTTNGGVNWISQTSGASEPLFSCSFYDADHGTAVGGTGKIIMTTNGGTNWNTITSPTSSILKTVKFINSTN